MTQPIRHMVIAVDGGGTRCRLVIDGPEGRHQAEGGPANMTSDPEAAIAEIRGGLVALARSAGLSEAELVEMPAYLGLAGITDAAHGAQIAARFGWRRIRVENDRYSAIRGALGIADGAIAHFGTGSFFVLQTGGDCRGAGGWGARLGDEGSAYWVAREALSQALICEDGLADHSPLTRTLLQRFGTPGGIVAFAAGATPRQIAGLAPLVTEAAAEGDAAGLRIMQAGADHIGTVLSRMGWRTGMAFCLTGGLGPHYDTYLTPDLADALVAPRAEPIEGAIALAHAFAAEAAP